MVKIRILSSVDLDVDFKTRMVRDNNLPKSQNVHCCCCFFKKRQPEQPITKIDKIIIHFHGGGFITMDSCTHQNYTRQWTNDLGIPVFSVDYRLAPKYPYPDPVNDCFQAYCWILSEAKSQLGIDPKQVILAGDSAGGHLCAAVTVLAILRGVRLPTGLILHYPALMLDLNSFFPSTLYALDDPILMTSFLKFCLASFVKNGDPSKNPIMSPLFTPDNIVQRFPPTRIMCCEADPLRDPAL